jgi:hypothetical protein
MGISAVGYGSVWTAMNAGADTIVARNLARRAARYAAERPTTRKAESGTPPVDGVGATLDVRL